jgi:hypothetical protein
MFFKLLFYNRKADRTRHKNPSVLALPGREPEPAPFSATSSPETIQHERIAYAIPYKMSICFQRSTYPPASAARRAVRGGSKQFLTKNAQEIQTNVNGYRIERQMPDS